MFEIDGRPKWRNPVQGKRTLTIGLLSSLAGALITLLALPEVEASPINILPSGKQLLLNAVHHAPAEVSDPSDTHEVWHIQLKNFSWPVKTPLDAYWQRQLQNSTIDLNLVANVQREQAQIQFSIFNHQHAQKGFVWLNHRQAIVHMSKEPSVSLHQSPATTYPQYLITGPEQSSQVQWFWLTMEQTDPGINNGNTRTVERLLTLVLDAMPEQSVRRVGLAGVAIQFDEPAFENIMRSEIRTFNINRRVLKTTLKNPPPLDERKLMHPFYSGEVHMEPTYWLFSRNLLTGKVTQSFQGGVTFHQAVGLWGTIRYHRLNFGTASEPIKFPKITVHNSKTLSELEGKYADLDLREIKEITTKTH